KPDDVARSSPHCHTQPDLPSALADGVRNHRVQPDRSEKKCDGGKNREQGYEDPYAQVVLCNAVFQTSHVVNWQVLVEALHLPAKTSPRRTHSRLPLEIP